MADGDPLAVIVLGAAVWPGGVPSRSLTRRATAGAALFLRLDADWLVPTGGVGRHPPAEADLATDILRGAGVPPERILPEARSTTTMENLVNARALLAGKGCTRVVIVSDWFHLPRAVLTARLLGLRARGHCPRPTTTRMDKQAVSALREIAALPVYLFRAARRR